MRRVLSHFLIAITTLVAGPSLKAQTPGTLDIKSGSNLSEYVVDENPSLTAFKSYLHSIDPAKSLGDRDYYASINLEKKTPDLNYECLEKYSSAINMFRSNVSVILVTLTISKSSGHLGNNEIYKDIPIIYIGKNFDSANNKPSNGTCFFNVARLNLPFVRHEGGSQKEDFNLNFKIHTTDKVNYAIVGTISNSFVALSGLLDWTDLTGARVQKISEATTNIQNSIASTFSSDHTSARQIQLLTQGEQDLIYDIRIPGIEDKKEHAAIYVELTASILLDNIDDDEISVGRVLEDTEVGATHCIPEMPTPKCQIVSQTFGDAFHQSEYGKTTPPRFFDLTPEGQKKVLDTCDAIRSFASTKLQLSTLDALLVRWAAVKYGNLDKALADPARVGAIARAVSTATGSPTEPENIIYACWNKQDQDTLAGVLAAMKKKLPQ